MAFRAASISASLKSRLLPSTQRLALGMAPKLQAPATLSGLRQGLSFSSKTRIAAAVAPSATPARVAMAGAALPATLGAIARDRAQPVGSGIRAMSSWRLRPYAVAGTAAALPMTSLSAGFSKVGLSLHVLPWKALPMALAVVPTVWALPAAYRMIFQNSMRHTTASVFTVILYLVLSFLPVPCFENLFSELTFYGIALVSTFFMYTFFPEVLLHDFMFMHYLALFTVA
eukprot:TRINITY_DN1996_c0_g2_i1.p1 TRINITY_DN1996_c0_g2~~TRINITY_DN1996_c0_g2_i1.p1  ORF type:complete len:229 (-),score=30.03 TRINITY_DN1996_c0_g2_i1:125-811(-)